MASTTSDSIEFWNGMTYFNMDEDTDGKDDTKRKSRNLSEKKRRDQFNMLIHELSSMVSTNNRKMDKSTVLKSTIAFLKSHTETAIKSRAHEIQEDWKPSFLSNEEFTHLILEALDGFILVFSASGKIFYSSDSVISLLGYKPNDLLNTSLYDMVFEDDQTDLYNLMLNSNTALEREQYVANSAKTNAQDNQISFSCHVRRGGFDSTYELVHFVGYFRDDIDTLDSDNINSNCVSGSTNEGDCIVFVGTGHLDQPQLLREITLVDSIKSEFTSKHSLEWKFLFLDHRAPPIIGYLPFEVLGTSGYDYYHIDDLEKVVTCHEALMQKGEGTSCYYRFLTKGQQWIWLQTRFYITYHQWNSKPEFIVCTNKVVNYMNILKQMDTQGETEENQDDNELYLQDSNGKPLQPVSSPWSSKSSVGKASRLALSGVSSPTPSISVLSSGTRGQHMSGGRPDSDSNSLSADSFTSKQLFPRLNPHFHCSHQYQSTPQKTMEEQFKMPCMQAGDETKASCSQRSAQLSVDASSGPPNASSVMSQPIGHQQIIDSSTPQHFMAAIPVQPVITAGGFSPAAASISQADILHQPLVMTPAQNQLQEQLQRKHEELQQLIFQQQQELRLVSDQLLMARYGLLPASLLSVSVPYSVASPSSSSVPGGTTLKPSPTPSSLPLPTSSDFFVPNHSTLIHSPITVAPPVVVDPQQVSVPTPSSDLVACNRRSAGITSPAAYRSSSGRVLQTLVMANKSSVPDQTNLVSSSTQVPQYYLIYGAPQNFTGTHPSDMLLVKTDNLVPNASSEPQSSASDGTQSTSSILISQTSEESDHSQNVFRRVKKFSSQTANDLSENTEQTSWPFAMCGKTGLKIKDDKTAAVLEIKEAFCQSESMFPHFRSETDSEKSLFLKETHSSFALFPGGSSVIDVISNQSQPVLEECDGKTNLSVSQSVSREYSGSVTPPSKILEACSSTVQPVGQSADLFSIPINELLQSKDEINWPPTEASPRSLDDFTGI